MAEPITIGGQTFIKTEDGWIDKKTKLKAPEGLTALLEKMNVDNTPQEKKKRVRIDTSRPVVKLGKSEYVWDLNGKTWIDKKTKDPVNPSFSKLIEATYQSIEEGVTADDQLYKKALSDATSKGMGSVGQAAKQKVRKPTGKGQFAVPNIKINSPIVAMIEKLATIDGYLKQRIDNQKMLAAKNLVATKEQQIETAGIDAQPVIDEEKIDAQVEAENKKSNAALVAVAIGAAGLIASQFDPVKEAFSGVVDFAKGVYGYLKDFINITNSGLESINSMGRAIGLGEKTSTPTPTTSSSNSSGNQSASMQSPVATQVSNPQAAANPMQSSTPAASSNSDEIVVTAPRRSASSSSSSASPSSSSSQAPVSSGDEIVVTAPRRSTSGSSDATRQSASPPTSGSPSPVTSEQSSLSSAQSGTVWSGSDASGMKTFVRKIGNKFETWTSADSTHYNIDESQAQAQISSRGLKNVNTGDATQQTSAKDTVDGYISPVEGYSINSPYGMRKHPVTGGMKFHTGVDIAAPGGAPVRAVKSGTVSKLSSNQAPYTGFGNVVIIDHGDGYQTVYAHLSKFACKVGEQVKQGQIIGYVGSTGMSTGNHLHFIVQKTGFSAPNQGNTVNPAPMLRKGGMTIPASMEGYTMEDSGDTEKSLLGAAAGAGWEMTKGAIEAVSNIIRAGAGDYTPTTGSQLASFDTEMAGRINTAAREKNAAIAASKAKEDTKTASDPLNLNAKSGSPVVQNLASSEDIDQVQKYLTRMGFPKIEYHVPIAKTA